MFSPLESHLSPSFELPLRVRVYVRVCVYTSSSLPLTIETVCNLVTRGTSRSGLQSMNETSYPSTRSHSNDRAISLKVFPLRRSLRGDKLLLAIARLCRSSLWSVGGSILGVSGAGAKMGLRRHRVPTGRLPGGHALGGIGVHLHVDLRGSLSGCQVSVGEKKERNVDRSQRRPARRS